MQHRLKARDKEVLTKTMSEFSVLLGLKLSYQEAYCACGRYAKREDTTKRIFCSFPHNKQIGAIIFEIPTAGKLRCRRVAYGDTEGTSGIVAYGQVVASEIQHSMGHAQKGLFTVQRLGAVL